MADPRRAVYGAIADRLEHELRAFGAWGSPEPAGPVTTAFGQGEMAFTQWLEHVLCVRLREVAAGRSEPPDRSEISAIAVREFDGVDEPAVDALLTTLRELDSFVTSQHG